MPETFHVRVAFNVKHDRPIFLGFLIFVLALPLLIGSVFPRTALKAYQSVPLENYGFLYVPEVLKETTPIDMLFVGASETFASFHMVELSKNLEHKFAKKPVIYNIGQGLRSEELIFQLLQDVLAIRHVKMVIFGDSKVIKHVPHARAKHFLTPSALDFSNLNLSSNAKLYSAMVLGGVRQLWVQTIGLLEAKPAKRRQNGIQYYSGHLGAVLYDTGYKPYHPKDDFKQDKMAAHPVGHLNKSADELFYAPKSERKFMPFHTPYTAYQTAFHMKIAALLKRYNSKIAIFLPPIYVDLPNNNATNAKINDIQQFAYFRPSEKSWILGDKIFGISQAELFPNLSINQVKSYYMNEHHLNMAGAKHLTKTLMPAFERLYHEIY
jgi:hypothetical protein